MRQVHKPQADGQWQLEVTSCVEVLVRNKAAILKALSDAKYDKITHVRQAVGKAFVEMDCIPSPRNVPSLAQALSGACYCLTWFKLFLTLPTVIPGMMLLCRG